MTWPAIKRAFSQDDFQQYVHDTVWANWRPSKIIWHNTAAPSLKQWMKSAADDQENKLTPGITRIRNLESFFMNNQGWSGCPHLFIANDFIWVMNALTKPGVHSPSYNGTSIGIEMIGDFDVEDDDTGEGFKVKQNTIFATAILCSAIGIDPMSSILLHKEDPRTTHDCPGRNIAVDKSDMIREVSDLMSGGEHDPTAVASVIADALPAMAPPAKSGTVTTNGLNFRRGPGVDNETIGSLQKGIVLTILAEARNGTGIWLKVKTPAGYTGWVSGRFVQKGD